MIGRLSVFSALFLCTLGLSAGRAEGPVLQVSVDTSASPKWAGWGKEASELATKWYPRLCYDLDSEGFKPAGEITIVIKPTQGVAATGGGVITIAEQWITKHPDDWGMVIHELCHVVQAYPQSELGWLVEGIADYERLYVFEPNAPRPRINPARAKYTDAYKTTAAFLNDLTLHVDPLIVKKLNAKLRAGDCTLETFKEITGKDVDTLWKEFVDRVVAEQAATSRPAGK